MFNLDKFINQYVTKRLNSMFRFDIEINRDVYTNIRLFNSWFLSFLIRQIKAKMKAIASIIP